MEPALDRHGVVSGVDPTDDPTGDPTGRPTGDARPRTVQDVQDVLVGVELPERPRLPLPRWLAPAAVCCLIGFIPWIVLLAMELPRRARAEHYNLAWVGFDIGMWLAIAALAWSAWRRRPWTGVLAAVTATMLVVDAWFDVVTAASGAERTAALLLAVLVEVPLAVICAWAAVNAERIRARGYQRLRLRWQRALEIAAAPPPATVATSAVGPDQDAARLRHRPRGPRGPRVSR